MSAPFSVIVPAYNEGAVIERCLEAMLADTSAEKPEIIVVCNGCTDDTANRARRLGDAVKVLELAKGNKPLALNTGNAAASSDTRIFVDADLVVDYRTLAAIADALDTDVPLVASPRLTYDDSTSTLPVRLYYKAWRELPYANDRRIGGIIGLNKAGLARVGMFPDVTADDLYVNRQFAPEEKRHIDTAADGAPVIAKAIEPHDMSALLHVETRRHRGTVEVNTLMQEADSAHRSAQRRALLGLVARPGFWPALAVYVYVKVVARTIHLFESSNGNRQHWRRDHTSRMGERDTPCSHVAD